MGSFLELMRKKHSGPLAADRYHISGEKQQKRDNPTPFFAGVKKAANYRFMYADKRHKRQRVKRRSNPKPRRKEKKRETGREFKQIVLGRDLMLELLIT